MPITRQQAAESLEQNVDYLLLPAYDNIDSQLRNRGNAAFHIQSFHSSNYIHVSKATKKIMQVYRQLGWTVKHEIGYDCRQPHDTWNYIHIY